MFHDKPVTKITSAALLIFTISSLFYCYAYIVQVIPSTISHSLISDLSINMTQLGILSGSFYWLYTSLQIPAGLLLDRYGARLMLTIAILTCATGTLIFGLSSSINYVTFGRILMGGSAAFSFTGAMYLVIRWLPPARLAMFAGIIQLLGAIGAICGESVLAETLVYYDRKTLLIIIAILGFTIAFVTWFLVRNRPRWFPENRKQHYNILKSLKVVLANPQTWFIAIYGFAIWGPILAFSALWGIPFLTAKAHLSNVQAADDIAITWIGIGLGSPVIGWISDKIRKRCLPLTVVALIGLVTVSVLIYIPSLPTFLLYSMLFFMGVAASGQTLSFAVVKDNNHISNTGAANGFNNMAIVLGGIVLQPIVGRMLDSHWHGVITNGVKAYNMHNYHSALLILPVCFMIAAIMSKFFIRETYCMPSKAVADISISPVLEPETL